VTHSKFPSPANDYIEDRIDLNREFVPSPMSTEHLTVVGDAMRGVGLFDGDLVLFDRAKLPSSGRCVVALHEGELIVRKVQGRPPRVSLVATDGITPPIWFGQGSDPEILGTVIVGVHNLLG
jgi:DNA polymerase V